MKSRIPLGTAVVFALIGAAVLTAHSDQDVAVALYRTSVLDKTVRERVAIFDGEGAWGDKLKYNQGHCELVVRGLEALRAPPGYWWCESVKPAHLR